MPPATPAAAAATATTPTGGSSSGGGSGGDSRLVRRRESNKQERLRFPVSWVWWSLAALVLLTAMILVQQQTECPAPPPATPVILLFDGVCNLCSGLVDFVLARNQHNNIRLASLQSPVGRSLLRQVDAEHYADSLSSMVVIETHTKQVFVKSQAAMQLFARLDEPWPWLYRIFDPLPTIVGDAGYSIVAYFRYNVFGKSDECRVASDADRARFLEQTIEL